MKRLDVKVCVCTQCVMSGAMDIVESIESLQKLKSQLRFNATINIIANERLCVAGGKDVSPLVIINGETIEKATSETVTAKIIGLVART